MHESSYEGAQDSWSEIKMEWNEMQLGLNLVARNLGLKLVARTQTGC